MVSVVEGRSKNLQLTEYVLVGTLLATFIASLSVRYRMSRTKIQEFLHDWTNTELSIGTLDRCIREAGIACVKRGRRVSRTTATSRYFALG